MNSQNSRRRQLETAQTSFIPVAKIENAELLKNSCMLKI